MGRGIAKLCIVPEDDELLHRHFSARRTVVIFKHIDDRIPEQLQIVLVEARDPARQIGGDEAVRAVEGVGDDMLAPHFRLLFQEVRLGRDRHTCD